MSSVLVLNGPNLGRLGSREPDVYGSGTLQDLRALLERSAPAEVTIDLRQTNDEAELIGWLYEAVDSRSPVILNPAAFTHYSYALRDAVALVTTAGLTLIEVVVGVANRAPRRARPERQRLSTASNGRSRERAGAR